MTQRLAQLNLQFKPSAPSGRAGKKSQGNFVDAWSYLGMDEFLSKDAIGMRDQCRAYAQRVQPLVSHAHLIKRSLIYV